jgi:hypothetical protein
LVEDGAPRPPVRADADLQDEAGRGLLLVETMSSRRGWYPAGELGGKVVWAELVEAAG